MKRSIFGVLIVLALLLAPVKVRCGSPKATCAMPPAPGQNSPRYYYEYEPLIVMWLESITQSNLPFFYTSGTENG